VFGDTTAPVGSLFSSFKKLFVVVKIILSVEEFSA
jgi:hypothetical protein